MVKAKRRQLAAIATNKNNALGDFVDSSHSRTKGDLHEDDSWVIVKKQKITILIPPLSVPTQSVPQCPRTNQIPCESRKMVKSRVQVPTKTCARENLGDERKKSAALASKEDLQLLTKQTSSKEKLPGPAIRLMSECSDQLVAEPVLQPPSVDLIHNENVTGALRYSKTVGLFRVSNAVKQPSLPPYLSHKGVMLYHGLFGCSNGRPLQNQRMRALNLERKLERAGGLTRWLTSLGLGQFVQMFRRKNVNKFQLVNLTMGKLKDMGAEAVGPRRKLLHAIDCVCHSYHFKTF